MVGSHSFWLELLYPLFNADSASDSHSCRKWRVHAGSGRLPCRPWPAQPVAGAATAARKAESLRCRLSASPLFNSKGGRSPELDRHSRSLDGNDLIQRSIHRGELSFQDMALTDPTATVGAHFSHPPQVSRSARFAYRRQAHGAPDSSRRGKMFPSVFSR